MYSCKYCGKKFDNKFKCGGHTSRCAQNPTMLSLHICTFCGKEIIGQHSFTQHQNHCEQNPEKLIYKSPVRKGFGNEASCCKFCNKLCKNDNSLRNHERLCKLNPDRYSIPRSKLGGWPKGRPAWNKGLTKETDERVANQSRTLSKKYEDGKLAGSFTGHKHLQETKDKISKSHLRLNHDQFNKNSHGKRGWIDNMFFMSTWELAYYLFMRDTGHTIVRCPQKFNYVDESGKQHTYTPDFLIDNKEIVEIKGYETEHDRFKYTLVPNLTVIGDQDINPYLQYVYNNYKTKKIETLYDQIPDNNKIT